MGEGGGGGGGGGMAEEKKGDTLYMRSIKTLRKPASRRRRRAAGEVDMFISLRNLLGLRLRTGGGRSRVTGKTEEGTELFRMIPGCCVTRVPRASLAVAGECRCGLRAD